VRVPAATPLGWTSEPPSEAVEPAASASGAVIEIDCANARTSARGSLPALTP
jgi:hypothetical protein